MGEAPKTAKNFTHAHPKPTKYVPSWAKCDALDVNDYRLPQLRNAPHSQTIISKLLKLLVEDVDAPLKLVELEGDAVFMYAVKSEDAESWGPVKKKIGEQLLTFLEISKERSRELQAYTQKRQVVRCNPV